MSDLLGIDIVIWDDDLIIGPNGDFLTTKDYENNNPSTTRFDGYYNIIFSVFNRLNTIQGEVPWHPSYGSKFPLIVSSPNNQGVADLARAEFRNILEQDPRILEVKSVNVEHKGNQLSVKAELTLSGKSESTTFIFPNFFIE